MTAKIRFIFRLLCIAGCLLYGMAEMFFLFPFYSSKRKLRAIQLWSLHVLTSCGMKLQTFGTPPQEGRGQMLISNHISWLDIMAVNGAFPGRFVAKDDVAKWPVVGYLATQAQTVYVSRNRGIKGNSAKIAGVTEVLKNGDTVTIFPEGTRLPPGEKGRYKLGGARMAKMFEMDIVPVALNSGEFWPRNSFLKYPGTVSVIIGKPIAYGSGNEAELMAQCEQWIESQQPLITGQGPFAPQTK